MNIPTLDLIIILAYLAIIILIGILSARRKKVSSEGFFLAGRSLNWAMIGAALFAANISTIHMVGLAANGFKDGIVWGNFEWMATFLLIILALFFAPFYFRNKISTLPEFLEKRYGPKSRSLLAHRDQSLCRSSGTQDLFRDRHHGIHSGDIIYYHPIQHPGRTSCHRDH